MGRTRRACVLAVALALLASCGRSNPVLGDWDLDASETGLGAMLAVKAAGLETLSFDGNGAKSGDTAIPGEWVVEEGRVRLVREDGNGEHAIEVLSDDQIRVALPIGITATYRRRS
jgi:hypothetical protein